MVKGPTVLAQEELRVGVLQGDLPGNQESRGVILSLNKLTVRPKGSPCSLGLSLPLCKTFFYVTVFTTKRFFLFVCFFVNLHLRVFSIAFQTEWKVGNGRETEKREGGKHRYENDIYWLPPVHAPTRAWDETCFPGTYL